MAIGTIKHLSSSVTSPSTKFFGGLGRGFSCYSSQKVDILTLLKYIYIEVHVKSNKVYRIQKSHGIGLVHS